LQQTGSSNAGISADLMTPPVVGAKNGSSEEVSFFNIQDSKGKMTQNVFF